MTDIKIGYTTSDYFYTLETEKVPDHQTCETKYTLEVDNSCSKIEPEVMRCFLLDFSNESGRGRGDCLQSIDASNAAIGSATNFYNKYVNWIDSSLNCYNAALCNNRKYAEKIQEQQTRHLGTNQNYENMKTLLTNEQWKSIQLGAGILGIIGAIYLLRKTDVSVNIEK